MKHLFKNPQKKGKIYISYPVEKVIIELNEVKIKNLKELNDKKGFFLECNIPENINKNTIDKIKKIDNDAYECLKSNYQSWFINENSDNIDIDDIYLNSYDDYMSLILSDKIETDIIIDDEEKEKYDFINFINENKKNKNIVINLEIILLGIYITKTSIINKWAIRYINIEFIKDVEWNKEELEEEWKYDLIQYEEETIEKIKKMEEMKIKAYKLYEEIVKETDIKIWENKLEKLKSIILRK
jgi:small nuclear ribonucleoprotein (snRNP)-like protein